MRLANERYWPPAPPPPEVPPEPPPPDPPVFPEPPPPDGNAARATFTPRPTGALERGTSKHPVDACPRGQVAIAVDAVLSFTWIGAIGGRTHVLTVDATAGDQPQLDEKLYLDVFAPPHTRPDTGRTQSLDFFAATHADAHWATCWTLPATRCRRARIESAHGSAC